MREELHNDCKYNPDIVKFDIIKNQEIFIVVAVLLYQTTVGPVNNKIYVFFYAVWSSFTNQLYSNMCWHLARLN